MNKQALFAAIDKVEKIASVSRFRRMLINPLKYFYAIIFREIVYKSNKKEQEVFCNTFFNIKMHLLLPSSTDIYLTGGKSHISELKLARFLLNNLQQGDVFLDIGAHYGYFSLLASKLVGNKGKVIAFEASPDTYKILLKNKVQNLIPINKAVSDTDTDLIFYEFPNLFAEYNALDINQYLDEKWFADNQPREIIVQSEILDNYLIKENIHPQIIKIDVEGAEYQVLQGAAKYLKKNAPVIAMEYLSDDRGNTGHRKAAGLLEDLSYFPNFINHHGKLSALHNIPEYLGKNHLESDNIVFVKQVRKID